MVFDFLEPINSELETFIESLSEQSLGKKIVLHTKKDFPQIEKAKIALVGVLDARGNDGDFVELNSIRKEIYRLFPGNWECTIIDLGDIPQGATQQDTYFAVSKITQELIKNRVIPVVLGGSQDLTYAMYRGYDKLDQMVNVVSIDSRFDFGKDEKNHTATSFLSKMIVEEPNNLFNYSNIGYQTYYNSQEEIDLIEKLFFDAYRLGDVSANQTISEPVFRDADLVSLDLTAVKSAESGNFITFTPNGFHGKEICALSRYAGISDKVSSFGIFNHQNLETEAVIIAQIVWYFIEGFHFRSKEYPAINKNNFLKYIVPVEEEHLVFFKSNKTERWWIEVPLISNANNKLRKNTLLPCTYDDYLKACDQEIPERWWKAQRKNII